MSADENYTLLQGFEWNVPADQKHWKRLTAVLQSLKDIGIDNVWLPPACKGAAGPKANGYDVYDLYDLGEFDQKGGVPTKWGPKTDLMELSKKAKDIGMGLYFDAVLNHKAGADKKEKVKVVEVDENDRNKEISEEYEIEAWLGFDFPGRGDKYSKQKYHWQHFGGTDYDAGNDKKGVFQIQGDGKHWSRTVGDAWGNADFLMFADIDYSHPEVIKDVINWGEWVVKELGLKGFRLDACQHYSERFTNEFVAELRKKTKPHQDKLFLVGEFWTSKVDVMCEYLDQMHHEFSLYDSALVYKISKASQTEKSDLRKLFDDTLLAVRPESAVTCVMNHDTQPGQTIATPVEGFFKPLAYAMILLRSQGYPSVFYGDLYGIKGENPEPPACGGQLSDIILARKLYAYGDQEDYLDEPNCIGFVRRGTKEHPEGLACILSNAEEGEIKMAVGKEHTGEVWTDVLGWNDREVKIDEKGYGLFSCSETSVSIYVKKDAEGRDRFGKFDDDIYAKA